MNGSFLKIWIGKIVALFEIDIVGEFFERG